MKASFDFKHKSSIDHRLQYFENTEVLRRVDKSEAKKLAAKSKDCLKQIESSTSVWAVDGKRFLVVFSEFNDDSHQKATVWGVKNPGDYQRIKTVWCSCPDYIFEAVALFLSEYFELDLNLDSFFVDVEWYYAIQDELADLARICPPHLKAKQKLLKVWSDIMPRYNKMISDLDFKILHASDPFMKDVKAPDENSDPEELLKSMIKLNPDFINDFAKALFKDDHSLCKEDDESLREVPDYIDHVVKKWERTHITEKTPIDLLAAYCRFDRAWNSFRAAVIADMVGPICDEYFMRTDNLGFAIDRKIHASKNLDEQITLMALFRLLIPQYIDHGEEKKNMEYERWWNKHLALQVAQSGTLSPARAELLVRVREDFKRLPAPVSKFIKTNIPKYLNEEVTKINKDSLKDLGSLKSAIRNLDNYIQWAINVEESKEYSSKTIDNYFELIQAQVNNVSDIDTWLLFSNLMTTGFAPSGTVKDRANFEKKVTERLASLVRNEKGVYPKREKEIFIEELLLASIYLENVFLKYKGCDIYTSYWSLYHSDLEKEKIWQANGRPMW